MKGKFELADGGTLFLDEISEMSPLAQVKILRVLEYGEFERLGSERMLTLRCPDHLRIKLFAARTRGAGKIPGRSFSSPERPYAAYSAPARAIGGTAGVDCHRAESGRGPRGKNITAIHPEAMERLLPILGEEICANSATRCGR